jgi:hypothetical protein
MEWLTYSAALKMYFKVQEPQLKHGLVKQEGLGVVVIIWCLMHLSTAFG